MHFTRVGKQGIVIAVLVFLASGLIWLAMVRDLGFYAPSYGVAGKGTNLGKDAVLDRNVVHITITKEMTGGKNHTTLKELAAFFALEQNTLECSVVETDQVFDGDLSARIIENHAKKPRRVGEEVALCLN